MSQSVEKGSDITYINWFSRSLASTEPNCVLVATIQEEPSLSVLEEFNVDYQNSFCRECVFHSSGTDPSFICSRHELLALDENYLTMSRYRVLISKKEQD
jgi:hypothetical protein